MSQRHDTETAFMEATYRALCTHGYADLTMQDIADETDKSKAALHYHFEGKADLLRRFLEYLHEDFTEAIADPPGETPVERLVALVREVLDPAGDDETAGQQFNTAFLEIKAQAPYREGYREVLERFDRDLREAVAGHVAEAVEAGQYPENTEPEEVAEHVLTYVHGVWTRAAAIGADVVAMREHLVEDLLELTVDGETVPVTPGVDSDPAADAADADGEASDADSVDDADGADDEGVSAE